MSKGAYIVLEGVSGSGKSTLARMLIRELQTAGVPVRTLSEADITGDLTPQTIAHLIADTENPATSQSEALLYNTAQAQSLRTIHDSIEAGVTCIVERSYLWALVHEYYGRGRITDYDAANEIIRIGSTGLQPDLLIVLDTPVDIAAERLSITGKKIDEAYLERVRAGYLWEAKQRDLTVIYANDPIETVLKHVQSYVSTVVESLGPKNNRATSQHAIHSVAEVLASHPAGTKTVPSEPPRMTPPVKLAAKPQTKAQEPVPVVKVQPRPTHYTIIKRVSIFAQQELKQARTISYADQFAQTPFEYKDERGHYSYYIPENISDTLRSTYVQTMDQIFDRYAHIVTGVTDHIRATSGVAIAEQNRAWREATRAAARNAARAVLPVAVESNISVHASGQALKRLITHLQSSTLTEVRIVGEQVLSEARKVTHDDHIFPAPRDNGNRIDASSAIKLLADKLLPNTYTTSKEAVALVQCTPRNEFDVVADMLYEYCDLPINDLRQEVSNWPYERKLIVFNTYMGDHMSTRHHTCSALETISYNFDVVCDYGVFCDLLQPDVLLNSLVSQPLTPRIGYDTPELIEAAGLSNVYEECFDLSLGLYSKLQAVGNQLEAQYTALLGHKMRCKISLNAREALLWSALHDKTPQTHPAYRELVEAMQTKIAEVHPLIGEAIQSGLEKTPASAAQPTTQVPVSGR